MAIVQMKKLRLLAVRDSKEELLKELIRHGCVEFAEAEDALTGSEAAAFVHRESSELSKLKTQHQSLVHGIHYLFHATCRKICSSPCSSKHCISRKDHFFTFTV